MLKDRTLVESGTLTDEVESLLDSAEPEGVFHDTRECSGKVLLAALLLASPPTPRPKTETR
ncbi:hypothetical protein J7E91_10975 [Streptomyces sp. ISL-99]|uniref:hypothetical protein n=1 Tax=Streptomyces sp. ISL-99 TaxID=2819193 RepID=UPI001BE8D199|nr:hypothetical protein [Streptomyces sp. ISL-99]MBT2525948.1 hypothetical protein [Streptomyces sp. ISL-99]